MTQPVNTSTPVNKTGLLLYWASGIVAVLGAVDAIYLLVLKLSSNSKMCLGNGGCSTVNSDPHSEIFGIPISLIGLVAYLVIFGILLLEPRQGLVKANGPLLVFGMSLVGVIFSAYLTYVELYIIHAICPFCVASAVLITILFALSIIRLVRQL